MYSPSLALGLPETRNQEHKVVELLDGRLSWKCLVDLHFLEFKKQEKNTGCVQYPARQQKREHEDIEGKMTWVFYTGCINCTGSKGCRDQLWGRARANHEVGKIPNFSKRPGWFKVV